MCKEVGYSIPSIAVGCYCVRYGSGTGGGGRESVERIAKGEGAEKSFLRHIQNMKGSETRREAGEG